MAAVLLQNRSITQAGAHYTSRLIRPAAWRGNDPWIIIDFLCNSWHQIQRASKSTGHRYKLDGISLILQKREIALANSIKALTFTGKTFRHRGSANTKHGE